MMSPESGVKAGLAKRAPGSIRDNSPRFLHYDRILHHAIHGWVAQQNSETSRNADARHEYTRHGILSSVYYLLKATL